VTRRPLRYTLILASVGLSTTLAAVGGWRYARASAPLSGPIIVIAVDALRADHLPAYGYRQVATPAIDELAENGVVFERAYAHAPQTVPSLVTILTGRLPFETGVRDDAGAALGPGERLLSTLLGERGYLTGGVVSSPLLRPETGIGRGFDFFDAGTAGEESNEAGGPVERDGGASEQVAERWLETVRGERAFLFLHLNEPHRPHLPPERFAQYAPYDGEIAYADEIVGRLVRYLKTHQLYDRSTIILLSDHGEGLGDHGELAHGLFLYDEALRVPLIVKQEGNDRAGTRVSDVVQLIDVAPTILDLVKAPVPGNLRGRSLEDLLDGGTRRGAPLVYAEASYGRSHFGWSELTSATDGRYRYIRAPREELYDLERDPEERENLLVPGPPASLAGSAGAAGPTKAANPASDERAYRSLSGALDRLVPEGAPAGPALVTIEAPRPDPKDTYRILETYRAAVELAEGGEARPAIRLLQQLGRQHPELIEVWSRLARVAHRAERFEVALGAYRRLIALRPDDPAGHMGAAEVLAGLKRLREARVEAARAVEVAGEGEARAGAQELLDSLRPPLPGPDPTPAASLQ
jgi:arylsulfatase A-like enzyme